MKKLLEKYRAQLRQMRESAARQPDALTPLEQQEAAAQTKWFFTALRQSTGNHVALLAEGEALLQNAEAEYDQLLVNERAELRAALLKDPGLLSEVQAGLIKDGKVVETATAASMVEAAETKREQQIRETYDQAAQAAKVAADRRKEAVTEIAAALKTSHGDRAPGVAQEVASALPDEALKGDGWRDGLAKLKDRLSKIMLTGISSGPMLQHVARFPLDKDDAFTAHLGSCQEIATAAKVRPGAPVAPLAGGGAAPVPAAPARTGRPMVI